MVRSEENLPERAVLSRDMRLQRCDVAEGCAGFGLRGGVGVEVSEHEDSGRNSAGH